MNVVSLEKGKIPPQSIDLEQAVIGAMLVDHRGLDEGIQLMKDFYFYKDSHHNIFKAIKELYDDRNPVDLLTVSEKLKNLGLLEAVGGQFYLIQLTQSVSSSAHIEHHCRIVIQKYIQRQLIKNSNSIIEDAYDESIDVFTLMDEAYTKLNEVYDFNNSKNESKASDLFDEIIQKGIDIKNGKIKPGIETPITNLTNKTGGWRNGELIIFAARPGMGKTAFALLSAYKPALQGIPTAFFSLEMDRNVLVSRLISLEAEIDGQKFNNQGLSIQDVELANRVKKKIDSAQIYIDDTSNLTINLLGIKIKKLIKKHGIKLAVVDYLQLMSGSEKNREQEISKISRGLKQLAHDLKIPIIALSQLSRAVETRGGSKRPMLSDLRESGAIEQDADMVVFFYRPEYYGLDEWDGYGNSSCIDEAEYIVAKNRNGGLVRNRMKFIKEFTKFSDIDEDDNIQLTIQADPDDLPF